jgi:Transcriptional regulators of sugar metabolism
MLPAERHKKIIDLLSHKEIVTIPEFIDTFNISIETIRRDLTTLEKHGNIKKVYGGAKLIDVTVDEPTLENRLTEKLQQKISIGQKCCEFIQDGDCIFIDSGSTTYQIAKFLGNKKNLTIITNSLPVVNQLIGSDVELILIGGHIRHRERSVATTDYLFNFSELNIQKSFICAGGITIENGISDFNMQEVVTRKNIIDRSKEVYVVADSSKFQQDVTINVVPLSRIDYIITDSYLDQNFIARLQKNKINFILA